MPVFRVTAIYYSAGIGFTETYYSTQGTYQGAALQAVQMLQARMALSGSNLLLENIRISDDLVFRDAWFPPDFESIPGSFPGNARNLPIRNAVKVRMLTAPVIGQPNYSRTMDLAGLPSGLAQQEAFIPSAPWILNFGAWAALMISANWAIKANNRFALPQVPVTSVAAGGVVVLGQPLVGAALNSLVKFYWPRGQRPINIPQFFRITNFTDTSHFTCATLQQSVPSPSSCRLYVPQLIPLLGGEMNFEDVVGNHKRGRPIGQPPGRVRAR